MSDLKVVKKSQRGHFLSIIFSFTNNSYEAKESNVFDIGELAKIQFIFKYFLEKTGYHKVSMRSVKREKDCPVNIKVVCKTLNFSSDTTCSDEWSDWKMIGSHRELQAVQGQNVVVSFTEITVIAYKWTRIGFEKLYDDLDFTDFALEAADGTIYVHKPCIAAHCDAFRNMLTGPWVEAKKDCIQMKDVTKETIEDLKKFIYLGSLPETARLRNLLVLSCKYLMDSLKDECIRKLALTVLPEELNSLHTLACMYNIPQLSVAISQWTPDEVIDMACEIEKERARQTDEKESQTT